MVPHGSIVPHGSGSIMSPCEGGILTGRKTGQALSKQSCQELLQGQRAGPPPHQLCSSYFNKLSGREACGHLPVILQQIAGRMVGPACHPCNSLKVNCGDIQPRAVLPQARMEKIRLQSEQRGLRTVAMSAGKEAAGKLKDCY